MADRENLGASPMMHDPLSNQMTAAQFDAERDLLP